MKVYKLKNKQFLLACNLLDAEFAGNSSPLEVSRIRCRSGVTTTR